MTTRKVLLAGAASLLLGMPMVSTAAFAQDVDSGRTVFEGTCVACHGDNGRGAFEGVPNLASRLSKSDDELFTNISEGFESPGSIMAMPANGGNPDLTEQQVRDVIAYIRQAFGE